MPTSDPRSAPSESEHEHAVAALTELTDCYPEGYLDEVRGGWETASGARPEIGSSPIR